MGICQKREAGRVVEFVFKRDDLLYELENNSWIEGESSEVSGHGRHQIFDIAESGNVDRVNRMLSLAVSEAGEMLFPYVKAELGDPLGHYVPHAQPLSHNPYPAWWDTHDRSVANPSGTSATSPIFASKNRGGITGDSYRLRMNFPETMSESTVLLLRDLIWEYITCRVMFDWLMLTKSAGADGWQMRLSQVKDRISCCLLSRRVGIRRRLKPF